MTHSTSGPFSPLVLDALAGHGLRPKPDTSVELLRGQVSELYRYEIRRLRDRLIAGEIPKAAYAGAVRTLRSRYVLLSLPREHWRDA